MVNKNQELAVNMCINALNLWKETSHNGTLFHHSLIDEFVFDLEDDTLDSTNPELIGKALNNLLDIIKNM